MIESAITLTSEANVTVNMDELAKIIVSARDMPKLHKSDQTRFKELRLDQWVEEAKKEKKHEVIENKNDLVDAFFSITERHQDLIGKQELVEESGAPVMKVFKEINMKVNYLQLATATLAYHNHKKVRS
jgi:hypothetical protein